MLVKFDAEKIDEEIADLELELHVSELAIRKAEAGTARAGKVARHGRRRRRAARQKYPRRLRPLFQNRPADDAQVDRIRAQVRAVPARLRTRRARSARKDVRGRRPHGRQRKRSSSSGQRTRSTSPKFNLEQTKLYCDELLHVRLPRIDIDVKESLDKAALELAKAKTALALDLDRARYDLEQQKQTRTKSLDRHAKLLDRSRSDGNRRPRPTASSTTANATMATGPTWRR